jgi:uncharacterized protein (TIGR03435 family)
MWPGVSAQQPGDTRQRFDVTSVKPCTDIEGRRGAGFTPGRLELTCQTLETLVREAYLVFAGGGVAQPAGYNLPLMGAPDWTRSEGYLVTATATGSPARAIMRGPMLQTLLEDRFKLRVRQETREVPIYALTGAGRALRSRQVDENECVARDISKPAVANAVDPVTKKPFCQTILRMAGGLSGSMTMGEFADAISAYVDRPVVNQTGITGVFNLELRFAADGRGQGLSAVGPPAPGGAVSIFTAIQEQLGLRLEPARGPSPVLVIEHAERPSPN